MIERKKEIKEERKIEWRKWRKKIKEYVRK
jgi:hypothetical protein